MPFLRGLYGDLQAHPPGPVAKLRQANAAGFMMLSRVLDLPDLYVCMGISAGWLTAKLHR